MSINFTSRLGRASAALAIAGLAVLAAGAGAEARDYRSWDHHHHHHWNNGWHGGWNNGWNNHWNGGWNGWQSSNGYGYTWPQRYWGAPVYRAPTYYNAPQAYSYYPEPVGRGLTFTIPLP